MRNFNIIYDPYDQSDVYDINFSGRYIVEKMNEGRVDGRVFGKYNAFVYYIKKDEGRFRNFNPFNTVAEVIISGTGLVRIKDKKRYKEISDIVERLNKETRSNFEVK